VITKPIGNGVRFIVKPSRSIPDGKYIPDLLEITGDYPYRLQAEIAADRKERRR
jgi:hypothetical protein